MPSKAYCPLCKCWTESVRPDGTHWCGAICDITEHDWECHQCPWTGPEALGEREEPDGMGGRILTGQCPQCGEGLVAE